MDIKTRQSGDVTILDLRGKIVIGQGDEQLRAAVMDALASGNTKLLLNMGSVTTIDSSGVGELIGSYTTVSNRGGKLKLLNLPSKVQDILLITQLITVFDTYDNEQEAVDSFS